MREILFRGKYANSGKYTGGEYPENGEWIYGDLVRFEEDAPSIHADSGRGWYGNYRVAPSTVGQFTGLYDHAGQRIFEGDIVRVDPTPINGREFDGYSAVVGFTGGAFGLERVDVYCHRNAHYLEHGFCEVFWPFGHCEYLVIGNIHDNPEMLSA